MKANFKVRCSAIGQIMTEARSKSEPLSQTCKSYLELWAKEQIYGRKKEVTSKYMQKGIDCEAEYIEFVSEHMFSGHMLLKNEENFENEYMTGTPDLILADMIIDVKNSWDCFTFPVFNTDLPEKNYYWQVQGYMSLTGKNNAQVIYTLMDTPIEIVEKEIYYKLGEEWGETEEAQIRAYHTYKNIPVKYRFKAFHVYRNDQDIERINQRVIECNTYIKSL